MMRKLPVHRARTKRPPAPQLGANQVQKPLPAPAKATPALVEPLAPARYKAQFTASAELKDKIELLRGLMRGLVPDGDLGAIIEEAVTQKLERLESRRFGKSKSPRKMVEETDTSPSSRYIPAPVRRAVAERDGDQCTFVEDRGRRCNEPQTLQFHHHDPYARGGDHSPENVKMMCPTHNGYQTEIDYGKETMERCRRSGGLARDSHASPGLSTR